MGGCITWITTLLCLSLRLVAASERWRRFVSYDAVVVGQSVPGWHTVSVTTLKKKKSTEENNACVSMYEYLYSVSCEMGITCRVFPQRPGNKYVLLRAGAAVSLLKSFPTLTSLSYWAALKSSSGLIAQFQTIMILTDSMQNLDFRFKRQYFQSSAPVYPSIPPHLCSVHLRSACSY